MIDNKVLCYNALWNITHFEKNFQSALPQSFAKLGQLVGAVKCKSSLTLCRVFMPVQRWHFCTRLSCMYRKKLKHMIVLCLKSLLPPLLLIFYTCQVEHLPIKTNSYRKIIFFIGKTIFLWDIWNFQPE